MLLCCSHKAVKLLYFIRLNYCFLFSEICQPLIQPFHTTALDPTCLTSQKLYGDVCSFKCVNGYGIPNHDSDCSPDTVVLATNLGGNTFCETIDEFGNTFF